MADDKTTLAYWMRQTGGRKNAAYTLKKEYTNALAGRGKARTFKPIATSEMSVPRGYQYDPSTYKAPKASTVSGPNVGYKNPRDMAGKTNFKGTTGDKVKLGAAIVGGFAAVPAAVIAAPFVAGAVAAAPAVSASIGTASAIGAKASGVLSRGAGAVSKGARSAASPWVASAAKPVSRVPKRVVKPKVTKPKVTKPKTNPTAAMDYHTGALGGQSARMGSRSAPAAAKVATRKAATVAAPKTAARVPKRVTKPTTSRGVVTDAGNPTIRLLPDGPIGRYGSHFGSV